MEANKIYDIAVMGGGPAGFSAAIYAKRAGQTSIVIEGPIGGSQISKSSFVENYPGYTEGISGAELLDAIREQAKRLGADMAQAIVTECDLKGETKVLKTDDGGEVWAKAVVVATGAKPRMLGIGEENMIGRGVSTCATCDGFFFRKRTVAIVGGGDTAVGDAVYLSGLCKKVYLIVRRDELRANKSLQEVMFGKENVEVVWNSQVKVVEGNGDLEAIVVENKSVERTRIEVEGLFLAVGNIPNTEVVRGCARLDEAGYIVCDAKDNGVIGESGEKIKGVYAAGDVCAHEMKQAIIASASGAKAAMAACEWIMEGK